ncbi:hypothetical protein COV82_03825 [Candidatus Peregrinibacteria bacterium CG11_big_fil_rev_8_21_14_0_20_46_8]|nr:MAG: hypothetical protein COV82_03825 [Candidatus Peregrinibacteria bacterium CG11_big_fil_rev_8_21_14_0_20_46_8]
MAQTKKHLSELSAVVTRPEYQHQAQQCVIDFLALNYTQKIETAAQKISLRIHERPPSVQVIQHPDGGMRAGATRMREKITTPTAIQTPNGLHLASNQIVVANMQDLTRECIVVTLEDPTISTLLENDLLAICDIPALQNLRCEQPKIFIVLQRYLMGIEKEDGIRVPFDFVSYENIETLDFLSSLPTLLIEDPSE